MKLNRILMLTFVLSLFALSGCTQKQMDSIENTHESANELLEDSINKAGDFENSMKRLENELKK